MLPNISLFGLTISTYWMIFFIGLIGMAVISWKRADLYCHSTPKASAKKIKSLVFILLVAVFGLLGAKLLYVLANWQETLEKGIFSGGKTFMGALFFLPPAMLLVGRLLGMRTSEATDYCAPPVVFILMCIRLGCFMNGCCSGILIGDITVPVQLIEAFGDASIFVFLLYLEGREKGKGALYPIMLFLYGFVRFFAEFLRDTPKDILFFSQGQVYSAFSILIAIVWIVRLRNGKKTFNELS